VGRSVLIGLDGATFTILDELMRDGTMPFLRAFVSRGTRALLLSTPHPLTPPAWTSLMTGRTPGNHGVFDFMWPLYQGDRLFIKLMDSRDIRCETIWSLFSRQGCRVASLNFPVMFPPRPVNGYLIAGFVPWRHLSRAVYPPQFYETLKTLPAVNRRELMMDLDQEKKSIQGLSPEEYEEWIALHIRRERQWFEITRYLLLHDRCDLIAVLFDGTDKLQHIAWPLLDPALLPQAPSKWQQAIRALCLEYFRNVDSYLERLVELAGPDARIFIVSDHGFGTSDEIFYVNVFLAQHGYLHWGSEARQSDGTGRHLPQRMSVQYGLIDWKKTTAYALAPSSNGIYIRVAREPNQPGIAPQEYETFRARLIEQLLQFRAPDGGQVVARVMTREEAFPGAENERAPDLTLVLRDYGFVSVLNAPSVLLRRDQPAGAHRPEGVFMATGPGIRQGFSAPQFSIVDIAPLLAYSLGLPVPSDFEGKVPAGIFTEDFLCAHPVVIGEPTQPVSAYPSVLPNTPALAESENAALLSRLKALGYVE
jgi:predicted AlkP superfamily phosphohydrolase/phosphomutase